MFVSFTNHGSWALGSCVRGAAAALALFFAVSPARAQEGAPEAEAAAPAAQAAAPEVSLSDTEVAAISFQQFCNEWLEKLVHREEQNVARIQWETSEVGVRGTFVGYSRGGDCVTKTGTDAVPVGKLTYKQVTYEKKGPTVGAAELSAARPLDVAEVTEIFRYGDGKWIY